MRTPMEWHDQRVADMARKIIESGQFYENSWSWDRSFSEAFEVAILFYAHHDLWHDTQSAAVPKAEWIDEAIGELRSGQRFEFAGSEWVRIDEDTKAVARAEMIPAVCLHYGEYREFKPSVEVRVKV